MEINLVMFVNLFWVFNAECSRETSFVGPKLDGDVCGECISGGVDYGGRVWIWRVGEHDQFHQAGWHIRTLRQVLPVPSQAASFQSHSSSLNSNKHLWSFVWCWCCVFLLFTFLLSYLFLFGLLHTHHLHGCESNAYVPLWSRVIYIITIMLNHKHYS